MALTTYNEIKAEILDRWEELAGEGYTDATDTLSEWADSTVPVYYSEVVPEWLDLSLDETDAWRELGLDDNASILERMKTDLYLHYERQFVDAYQEVVREKQGSAE